MADWLWERIAPEGVYHVVRYDDQTHTLCGEDVTEALEVLDELGGQEHRPCDTSAGSSASASVSCSASSE